MWQTKKNKKEEEHILEMIPISFLVPANLTQAAVDTSLPFSAVTY